MPQLYASKDPTTGRLSDMRIREPGANDVPLKAMPTGFGPFAYDAVNQLAIPASLAVEEQMDRQQTGTRVLAALAVRWSASWATLTAVQQAKVQAVLDQAGAATKAILTGS